ncbi:MAG: efflux RND transporter periplasmic adaptor subunit [Candidatus Acidiferrum sp.]
MIRTFMDKKFRNRTLLLLLLAGILAFFLIRASGKQPVAKISAMQPVREDIVSSISSNGKVEPISPTVIRAQSDTFIDRLHISEGQNVKKGQLLLELNVKEAAAQLAQAKSRLLRVEDDYRAARAGGRADESARVTGDLAKAAADRDRLQKNHDSLERLLAQGAATKDELATNDLALLKAESEVTRLTAVKQEFDRQAGIDSSRGSLSVEQAQSDVAVLEDKVRQGKIHAPVDGTVYSMPVRAGDFVKTGDLLLEMADLHKVRVRVFIDEPEMGALEVGLPVKITWDALADRVWQGTTETVPKQVVARGARSVGEMLCSVQNDKLDLLPNTNVNVVIRSKERSNVVTVPRGAVESEAGRKFVFLVRQGVGKSTLEKRLIEVGIADATNYEVVSGLSVGDVVALPGDVDLKDGMNVRVVNMQNDTVKGG